jgi:AraC-like DNA-binding protein
MDLQAGMPTTDIHYESHGLCCRRETPAGSAEDAPHSHNEVEFLRVERGQGRWLMGGTQVPLAAGQLLVFWAIRPHQLVKASPSLAYRWLTVPLPQLVEWRLPEFFARRLLAGERFLDPSGGDGEALALWQRDLEAGDPALARLALLEIEARLWRLVFRAAAAAGLKPGLAPAAFGHRYYEQVSSIADFVSRNFSEPITVKEVAGHVHMHPASATKLFKKACGLSLMHYITQHRVFHAQRLLLSTDRKILDVALESGYQSASRFYAAFRDVCGMTPQNFRSSPGKAWR